MANPLTIVQVSDFHFGGVLAPAAAAALPDAVAALRPDLVVCTGDFTQRAKESQFADAAALWRRLPEPRVAVVGNHDVPTYRLHERLLAPYARYRRHIGGSADDFAAGPGYAGALLNTNSPWSKIVHGRLRTRQLEFCARRFAAAPPDALRFVAGHHPFLPPPERPAWPALAGGAALLANLAGLGVELVFGGHWHVAYFLPVEHAGGRRLWVVQAGTATSTRGRLAERGRQTFNSIRVEAERFVATVHEFQPERDAFAAGPPRDLPRAR